VLQIIKLLFIYKIKYIIMVVNKINERTVNYV